MPTLRDPSILGPIAYLGPDLSAQDWANRLQVSLDEVVNAFSILNLQPKAEIRYSSTLAKKKKDQAADILDAIYSGQHRLKDIASYIGLHVQTTANKLKLMEKTGLVRKAGTGRNVRWII